MTHPQQTVRDPAAKAGLPSTTKQPYASQYLSIMGLFHHESKEEKMAKVNPLLPALVVYLGTAR
jgi:hypothetical protein